MPKLVIKQDVGVAGRKARQDKWLSLGGLLLLLIAVAGTAYVFTRPADTSSVQEALLLDSAQDSETKARYLSMHKVFNELAAEYSKASASGLDDYQKNTQLFNQSEEILAHLDEMNALADQLGLSNDDAEKLFNRYQFNKDYWQAKSHFRQLRISRFESAGEGADIQAEIPQVATDTTNRPKKFQFAKPPEGMELPEGFCDLSNPDSSCKPEAGLTAIVDNPDAPTEPAATKPKKFQFAKPPEGFCDLSDPDSSCKPETKVSGEGLTLPEDMPNSDTVAAPRKFQFAKPPEGMKLPDGFCDLSDPAASCKPGAEAQVAVDENSNKAAN